MGFASSKTPPRVWVLPPVWLVYTVWSVKACLDRVAFMVAGSKCGRNMTTGVLPGYARLKTCSE